MLRNLLHLTVIGCWPYEPEKSGFALPVFAHPENASILLVQEINEVDATVGGFSILRETDLPLLIVRNAAEAVIGSDPVYAFLADNGLAYAGTAVQLQTLLRDFLAKNPSRHATNLQIAELIGTEAERKNARAKMRHVVAQRSGANAAASFYAGALQSILWNTLVRAAQNEDIARRILSVRSRISASIGDGALVFDLEAISPTDRSTINIDELQARILSEFELLPNSETAPEQSTERQGSDADSSQRKVIELLRHINGRGRQEERISVLMDSIIADRDIGLSALLQYGADRAKYANWTLGQLRNSFFQPASRQNSPARVGGSVLQPELFAPEVSFKAQLQEVSTSQNPELVIASLIPKLFTQQFPMSRGELLYYLSKHLARWPQVNRAIQQSLDRTASVYVHDWRRAIEDNLSAGRAH